ncbi:hypothetical protein [Kitasatospora sp. NPDC057541]|uniref:hypothetical protein n=1 Tax=unclassified Kitasatospora TaxID=2633591 RepID=UPI0036ADAF81
MSSLEALRALLGAPTRPHRPAGADGWAGVERYVGRALPGDFKAFLDEYGSGAVSGELLVFHPEGSIPLAVRMAGIHWTFSERRRRALERGDARHLPYPFHPEPGGLISWGFDQSGHEHFFLPCDPDPDRWKVVTMVHEEGCETFDGSFTDFVLAFVRELSELDRDHGIDPAALEFLEPEDLEELAAEEGIGPVPPGFEPF